MEWTDCSFDIINIISFILSELIIMKAIWVLIFYRIKLEPVSGKNTDLRRIYCPHLVVNYTSSKLYVF